MKCNFLGKVVIYATLFFCVASMQAQSNEIKKIEQLIKAKKYESASTFIKQIDTKKISKYDFAKFNYLLANLNCQENRDDLAFDHLIVAKKSYTLLDSIDKVAQINIEIVSLLLAVNSSKIDYNPFLNEYINYAKQKNDPDFLSQSYMQIGKSFYDSIPQTALFYFKKAEEEIKKTKNELFHARILQNMGATYAHDKLLKIDSALIVYDKALKIYTKTNSPNYIFNIYTNKGLAYSKKNDYAKALYYYHKADSIPQKEFDKKNKEILYGFMSEAYKNIGDYKSSIIYLDKQKVFQDILNEKQTEIAIKEIDTRYNTTETKLENKKLKSNQKYLLIGLIILGIALTIGVLTYKNLSKKKKIIEQEKQLETQKLETTLKEQELHEIDVMLESQEKERQRIANELHDNLGSMLATLKLNFENLKRNDSSATDKEKNLFAKTDSLIEEAYQEVRNISHLKNLGVIGSEGLVIAVKKMAEKMSVLEKLHINVIPHGLNERLENALEVMLFRMIQELCTNIIKHSEATEVNIYLTQHNNNELNIIIEDNGIGFDPKNAISTSGIGLKSIEKKVEQMNGTFTIDSIISKGTTIIIDLPI